MSDAPVFIVDIDNCIANDAWRIPFIDWAKTNPDERYHPYHAMAWYDENDADWLKARIEDTSEQPRLFALTARSTRYHALTEMWLQDHITHPVEAILMRNPGDHRPSAALKRGQLLSLVEHYDVALKDIVLAADDRQDVLDAYADIGVNGSALLCRAIHDVCAYTKPAPPRLGVPELMRAGASTYEQRNALYGDNYKHFGHAMRGVFPAGLHIESVEDWNRLGILVQCAAKLTRYGQSFSAGGHADSAHDLSVYAAMLQELTQ